MIKSTTLETVSSRFHPILPRKTRYDLEEDHSLLFVIISQHDVVEL
jgi:hypothetical protein